MEARRTSLERALAIAFILVIAVMVLMVPVLLWAMNGITAQAEVLNTRVIRGQLAYAQVASDADSLRAATLEAATNTDPKQASTQLELAKALVKKFPVDSRNMTDIFCPPATKLKVAADDLTATQCSKNSDEIAKQIGASVDTFGTSASGYDFQALSAVSLLQSGKAKTRSRRSTAPPASHTKSKPKTEARCSQS